MTVGSGRQWAVLVPLLAGVAFAWPTYVRYFGVHPGPMIAALCIAFAMYLPSLWAIRFLDRHDPQLPLFFWGSIAFVILFAPITARVMHAVIDSGLLPYWVVVGPLEELTKLLPLLLLAWLAPGRVNSMRDGIVLGALGGLGFAIVEFGANFAINGYPDTGWADLGTTVPARWALGTDSHIVWGATAGAGIGYLLSRRGRGSSLPIGLGIFALVAFTHGFNDLYGKYIGTLSTLLLLGPMQWIGVDMRAATPGAVVTSVSLIFAAVMNTLLVNVLLWPVLAWGIRRSGRIKGGA